MKKFFAMLLGALVLTIQSFVSPASAQQKIEYTAVGEISNYNYRGSSWRCEAEINVTVEVIKEKIRVLYKLDGIERRIAGKIESDGSFKIVGSNAEKTRKNERAYSAEGKASSGVITALLKEERPQLSNAYCQYKIEGKQKT